jgi:hypothetical protein
MKWQVGEVTYHQLWPITELICYQEILIYITLIDFNFNCIGEMINIAFLLCAPY